MHCDVPESRAGTGGHIGETSLGCSIFGLSFVATPTNTARSFGTQCYETITAYCYGASFNKGGESASHFGCLRNNDQVMSTQLPPQTRQIYLTDISPRKRSFRMLMSLRRLKTSFYCLLFWMNGEVSARSWYRCEICIVIERPDGKSYSFRQCGKNACLRKTARSHIKGGLLVSEKPDLHQAPAPSKKLCLVSVYYSGEGGVEEQEKWCQVA